MRENPYTQVRINKKNYPVSYISCLSSIGFACNNSKHQHICNWSSLGLSQDSNDDGGWCSSSKLRSNRARAQLAGNSPQGRRDVINSQLLLTPRRDRTASTEKSHAPFFFRLFPTLSSSNRILAEITLSLSEYWYPYNGQKKKKTSRLAYV